MELLKLAAGEENTMDEKEVVFKKRDERCIARDFEL